MLISDVYVGLLLDGAHGWSPTLFIRLIQDFGMDSTVGEFVSLAALCSVTLCFHKVGSGKYYIFLFVDGGAFSQYLWRQSHYSCQTSQPNG